MKQPSLVIFFVSIWAPFCAAKTALYGEANAFGQVHTTDQGSAIELEGYLSHLGFRNRIDLEQTQIYFDVSLGFNALGYSVLDRGLVYTRHGEIGIEGDKGQLRYFYGDTPLSASNQMLRLMDRDPDGLSTVFNVSAAQNEGLEVGLGSVDGIAYRSPTIGKAVSFDLAVVPAEVAAGESGYSVAGQFETTATTLIAAYEINVEAENAQIARVVGQQQFNRVNVGLGFQWAINAERETQAQTYFAVLKFPWQIAGKQTQAKAIIGWNQLEGSQKDTTTQLYMSFVDEWALTGKASVYGFAEIELANDLNDVASYAGLGLRMPF